MCGRSIQYRAAKDYLRHIGDYTRDPDDLLCSARDVYDVPPGAYPLIILSGTGEWQVQHSHWGLVPAWAKTRDGIGPKPFNARADTLLTNGLFRRPAHKSRCLFPVDGWYEWTGDKGTKRRHVFTDPDGKPLMLAGLYDVWRDKDSEEIMLSFTVVTRDPQYDIAGFHDRSPVIVPTALAADWMDTRVGAAGLLDHLTHLTHPIRVFEVARVAHGPDLLQPLSDAVVLAT